MRVIVFIFFIVFSLDARTITDDYGRVVKVPKHITKIYAASPPISMSLLAFNPDLLVALNSPFNEIQKKFVGSAYDKPVVGGFMGQGNTPNFEILISLKPDVVVMWGRMSGYEKILDKFKKFNIPVILVKNDTIYDLISQFGLYAKLTGDEARANELIAYTKESLNLVEQMQGELAKQKPIRYYFAEGVDGQYSECEGSFHIEPFKYAGAKNALECKMSSNYGMEKLSLETILLSDPDVIVAMESSFVHSIYDNPQFSTLRAVKEKKVFLVPSSPFNYISRPPSFMRLLGIRWLIDSFYPTLRASSFLDEKEEFFKLFFVQRKRDAN